MIMIMMITSHMVSGTSLVDMLHDTIKLSMFCLFASIVASAMIDGDRQKIDSFIVSCNMSTRDVPETMCDVIGFAGMISCSDSRDEKHGEQEPSPRLLDH